ncbi:MAG: VOC family protein [Candidatus Riflebacteria bacterium]|nr:VOC family protein [Candidatus Riflebacteria bacterium]
MGTVELAHIGLVCKNMEETESFYSRHFGFARARVIDRGDLGLIIFLKNPGGLYLELFPATAVAPVATDIGDGPNWPGFKHIAFAVENIDEVLAHMGDEALITQGPMDLSAMVSGWRTVWLRDPDGRILEISEGYADEKASQ